MSANIGFTGTRKGWTAKQALSLLGVVDQLPVESPDALSIIAHHGDCIGSDERFHRVCRNRGFTIVGHIPDNDSLRAFCHFDEDRVPLPYIQRNQQIVLASDFMLATPAEEVEQQRGGTWSTIRFARRQNRPLAICLPSGRVVKERWP